MRVRGEGPRPCELMFVGEAPGEQEDKAGRPFVGKAGAILNALIRQELEPLGWGRRAIYLTNLVKERPPGNRDPLPEEIERDAEELRQELLAVKPTLIVTLGRFATRSFLGPVDMDTVHGMCWTGKEGWLVFPVVHPAAGLHSPDLYALTAFDMENLGRYLAEPDHPFDRFGGEIVAEPDLFERPEYREVRGDDLFHNGLPMALDTEGDTVDPICMSVSQRAGEGLVVRPDQAGCFAFGQDYVLHHALHDLPVLRAMGLHLPEGRITDTMVMAYLLRMEPQGLKALALRRAGMAMRDYEEVVGHWVERGKKKIKRVWSIAGRTLRDVGHDELVAYAGRDPDATLRVYHALKPRIHALGLDALLSMELGIIPIIDRIQTVGMAVDLKHFVGLGEALDAKAADLLAGLRVVAGKPDFNPGSPKQVADFLFEDLGIASKKRTKSGAALSTNDKILQALHHRYERDAPASVEAWVLNAVMDWREARKMRTAFCDPLPAHVAGDGRFHPNILTTRVETGRLAGKGMNPLAFPKHSDWGHQFRAGFVAGPGRLLGSWDLGQIELRILAHLSGDPTMLDAFRSGRDLHAELVTRLWGVPKEAQSPKLRREGKTINFGIPMGITAKGLLEQFHKNGLLDKTEEDAEEILYNTLHKVYPGVWAFQEDAKAEARRTGQVRDMWGRIYYLPSVHAPMEQLREGALREAAALKIQGGAAGYMKLAMAAAWEATKPLRAEGAYCEPWLQVHDDLLFEYDEGLEDVMAPLIMSALTGAAPLSVPVTANHVAGRSWGELE